MGRGGRNRTTRNAGTALLYGELVTRSNSSQGDGAGLTLDELHVMSGGLVIVSKNGTTRRSNKEGQLHCDHGPAVERGDGARWWYGHGLLHCEDGPAVHGGDEGTEYWITGIKVATPEEGQRPVLPEPEDRRAIVVSGNGEERHYLIKYEIVPGPLEFRDARQRMLSHRRQEDALVVILESVSSISGDYRYTDLDALREDAAPAEDHMHYIYVAERLPQP